MAVKIPRRRLLLGLMSLACAVAFIAKRYESVGTAAAPIALSKRVVAEAGLPLSAAWDYFRPIRTPAPLFGPAPDPAAASESSLSDDTASLARAGWRLSRRVSGAVPDRTDRFEYERWDTPQLETLRRRYGVADIARQAPSQFEAICRLRDWVRSRWDQETPANVDYRFNALDILRRAEAGERFFCSEYATTYVQVLSAAGLTGRYVGLFDGHATVEVWSDDWRKWILMDPTFDCHYVREEIPLNALEIHNAVASGAAAAVTPVTGPLPKRLPADGGLSLYRAFFIRMRNNWFSHTYPHWHRKANAIMNSLEWQDAFTTNDIRVARETGNADDLYWPINQVAVSVRAGQTGAAGTRPPIHLRFATHTPDFSGFEVTGISAEIQRLGGADLLWNPEGGQSCVSVRAVNAAGWRGAPAEVCVAPVDPP